MSHATTPTIHTGGEEKVREEIWVTGARWSSRSAHHLQAVCLVHASVVR
jgi:hypothetical protein